MLCMLQKKKYPAYVSKHNWKHEKQVCFLLTNFLFLLRVFTTIQKKKHLTATIRITIT